MTNYQNYLEHHGVLGMKWGVRRYQNEDGSRTELGKAQAKALKKGIAGQHLAEAGAGVAIGSELLQLKAFKDYDKINWAHTGKTLEEGFAACEKAYGKVKKMNLASVGLAGAGALISLASIHQSRSAYRDTKYIRENSDAEDEYKTDDKLENLIYKNFTSNKNTKMYDWMDKADNAVRATCKKIMDHPVAIIAASAGIAAVGIGGGYGARRIAQLSEIGGQAMPKLEKAGEYMISGGAALGTAGTVAGSAASVKKSINKYTHHNQNRSNKANE